MLSKVGKVYPAAVAANCQYLTLPKEVKGTTYATN